MQVTTLVFSFVCVFLAAVVRGYAGFGFSLLSITALAIVLEPRQIVPSIFILEVAASAHLLVGAWRDVHWPSLRWLALGCLLGMGRDGCENLFVGADRNPNQDSGSLSGWDIRRRTSYCSGDYIYRRLDYCPDGFLETVQYLGANLEGDDVYLVQFMHADQTYVISQLTPEGKIRKFWRFDGPPIRILQYRRLVELRTPINAPQTIYSRQAPAQGGIRPEEPQRHGP